MNRSFSIWAALALAAGLAPAHADDRRIIALGGTVAEIVAALGAESALVGRDTTSSYPPSVLGLPDVGYLRALSPEGVLSLSPDLILAEGDAGPPEAVDVLRASGVEYVSVTGAPSAEGVIEKINAVATVLGKGEEAAGLADAIRADMADIAADVAQVQSPKRVLFVLSLQGGAMAAGSGTEAEAIIALAGGINAATGFAGYKPMTDEAVLAAAPDVILMMAREGDLAIADSDVMAHPALAATPAAQAGAIVRMDGLLMLGFGPRLPQAVRDLHKVLYGG